MGEVYRARDTKLHRDVAVKVLPEGVARDPERLARFTREAQTLAALNHPNIAHIHGLEESGGVRALVMELVDGEDLAQRLPRVGNSRFRQTEGRGGLQSEQATFLSQWKQDEDGGGWTWRASPPVRRDPPNAVCGRLRAVSCEAFEL